MPDIGSSVAVVSATYVAIQNVKLYKKQCEDLRGRCLNLLNAIHDSSRGLEGAPIVGITDELGFVIERIQAKIVEWSTWNRLKCVVQQGDMKDGLDRLNRELDSCMMKFNVQANVETHRSHIDLKSTQERDNANFRELLLDIVKSQDEMRQLLNSHSSPVVEGVMENLQTQLMAPGLQPVEARGFKAGLWQLHEKTSRLPPLTDLSGQIALLPSNPIFGSSNDIYQGQWLDKQKVALRCPRALDDSPVTRKRFEIEVSSWRRLNHPNVVPLYGFVNLEGTLYSVTPWMDNGTASTYVARFPSADRMKLLYEIACGLEYLHKKDIIHGDLRAHNILISEDGSAWLSDFGLSSFFDDCDQKLIPYNNASLRWTAPEVLRNGSISTQSDVWSFGMVCLEILSGRIPFHGKDDKGVEHHLDHGKHPDRSASISEEMWDLMLRCWSKNPEARPPIPAARATLDEIKSYSPSSPFMNETMSSESYHPESPSRRPTLKKITTFFGRNSITSKPSSSSLLPTMHGNEFSGRRNDHDWRTLDRTSSTQSLATMSSLINSASTGYPTPSLRVSNPPQPDHRQSLKPPSNSPPFNSSSKRGNNLWDESQTSPINSPKAKASNQSRPSTGTSSLRQWPSPDLYEIPDDDVPSERNGSVHSRHWSTGDGHQELLSRARGNSGQRDASYDYVPGRNPPTGESSRSALMAIPSRNTPANSLHRNTSPNSTLDQGVAAGVPPTAAPFIRIPPSQSNSANTLVEPPPLGIGFLSSSPPRILGGSLSQSPPMRTTHLRSSTTESSQSINPNVLAIKNATETRRCILNDTSGHVSSGTLEGLVQFLIDGFDSPRHTEYRNVFLMACAEFTTPDGLFQILSRRFFDEEMNENAERRVIMQYNILMIISYWLKGGYLPPSQELLYRMKFFCEDIAKLKFAGTLLDRANDVYYVVALEVDKLRKPPSVSLEPRGRVLQSSQVKPPDLAIGMTLLEGDNYGALGPSDYIIHLTKHQSVKVKKLYDTNNKIKTWVTESILHFDDVHDRAEVLTFFIHTALECQKMRNFSSAAAIASALHSTAVDNLTVTRKSLTRSLQSKLSDLYDIINPESNHRGYREFLHAHAPVQDTCVPWMAFHLKELGKVLRAHPVTLEEDGQHLINFDRYLKFMDRIKETMYYLPPHLEGLRHQGQLAYLLNQLQGINLSDEQDDHLMAKSKSLMLQEASDYRTRKPQLVKLGFDF